MQHLSEWKDKLNFSADRDRAWLLFPRGRMHTREHIADVPFRVGAHVIHLERGKGVVEAYEADGRMRVYFESGDAHRYRTDERNTAKFRLDEEAGMTSTMSSRQDNTGAGVKPLQEIRFSKVTLARDSSRALSPLNP
jgi:hypothetical protein